MLATQEDVSVRDLILRYHNDIQYDCHSLEARYRRSSARKELSRKGREALGPIGAYLFSTFHAGYMHQLGRAYDDLFVCWLYLLYDIAHEHKIVEYPYPNHEKFGEQDMNVWIAFCFKNAI